MDCEMETFVVVIIAIVILSIFFNGRGRQYDMSFLCICFLLLLFVKVSVVWREWGDLPQYYCLFQHTTTHDFSYYQNHGWEVPDVKSEWGWVFYTWLNSCISSDFYFLLLTTGAITLLGYFRTIYKYVPSYYFYLSVLIYVIGPYLQSFYVLRQHLAMGIMLFSYPYIINGKIWKFFAVTLISSTVHLTALFVVPLYFIYKIKNNRIFFLSILTYSAILLSIVLYIGDADDLIIDGYNTYLRAGEDRFSNFTSAALLLGLLIFRVFILKKNMFCEGFTRLLSIIIIIGSINAVVGAGRVMFMSRLNMYYSQVFFLIWPNTISFIKNRTYRVILAISYVFIMGILFILRFNKFLTGNYWWNYII